MMVIRYASLVVVSAVLSGCNGTPGVEPIALVNVPGAITAAEFSPSGSILATARCGGEPGQNSSSVIFWETASFKSLRTIPVPERTQAISFSSDGKTLAVAGGDYQGLSHAYLFDSATGEQIKKFGGSTGWIHDLDFSPDGKLLAFCGSTWDETSGQGYKNGKAAIWDVASGQERPGLESAGETYRSVAFAPGGQTYLVGGGICAMYRPELGNVHLCDATTGRTVWASQGHTKVVECVAFAPDGKTIASGGMDGVLKLCDAANGKEWFVSKSANEQYGRVLSVAFSPDGKSLAAALGSYNRGGNWGELRAWKLLDKTAHEILIFKGSSPVTCVAFSPDGRLLAAGDADGTMRVWESAKVFATKAEK